MHRESGSRSPDGWVSGLMKGDTLRFERIEVWAGPTPAEKNLRQHATIKIEPDADPGELYQQIDGCALACGARYVRIAAYAPGGRRPADLIVWPVPEPDFSEDETSSAADDPKNLPAAYAGLLRQVYAHNERLQDTVATQTQAVLMHLQTENRLLQAERVAMREALTVAERASTDREERIADSQRKLFREQTIASAGLMLARAASTHLAVVPGDAPPIVDGMRDLIASMTPEQMAEISKTLNVGQMANFTAIMAKLSPKEGDGPADK